MGIDCIDSKYTLKKFKIFGLKIFMKSFKVTFVNHFRSLKEIIDIPNVRGIFNAACEKNIELPYSLSIVRMFKV